MLRAMIGGALLGPVLLVAAVLLWSKAGLALLIAIGVLFGALVVAVLAGAAAGRQVQLRRVAAPTEPAARRAGVDARENLASPVKWRQAFMGWRYGPPKHK